MNAPTHKEPIKHSHKTRPVQPYVKKTHIKALCHTHITMACYDMILLHFHTLKEGKDLKNKINNSTMSSGLVVPNHIIFYFLMFSLS